MCIAVVKPKNIKLPNIYTLENCFSNNPDGAGLAVAIGGSYIYLNKGLMSFKEFKKTYDELSKKLDLEKCTIFYHFRIATVGNVEPGNTQPFVCHNKSVSALKGLSSCSDMVFMHNGTVSDIKPLEGLSDSGTIASKLTKDFVENYFEFFKLSLGTSKGAVLFDDGSFVIDDESKWYEEDGIFYSNLTYKYFSYNNKYDEYYGYGYTSFSNWNDWQKPSKNTNNKKAPKVETYQPRELTAFEKRCIKNGSCPKCHSTKNKRMTEYGVFCSDCSTYYPFRADMKQWYKSYTVRQKFVKDYTKNEVVKPEEIEYPLVPFKETK